MAVAVKRRVEGLPRLNNAVCVWGEDIILARFYILALRTTATTVSILSMVIKRLGRFKFLLGVSRDTTAGRALVNSASRYNSESSPFGLRSLT